MKLDNFLRLRDWDARNLPSDPPHIVYVRYSSLSAHLRMLCISFCHFWPTDHVDWNRWQRGATTRHGRPTRPFCRILWLLLWLEKLTGLYFLTRYEDLIANAGQGMRNLLQAFRCRYNFTKVEKAEVLVDHYKGYKNVPVNLTEEELLNVSKPYFLYINECRVASRVKFRCN